MDKRALPFDTRIGSFDDLGRIDYLTMVHRARCELPSDWHNLIAEKAYSAVDSAKKRAGMYWVDEWAVGMDVWAGWLSEYGGDVAADLSDSEIKALALKYEDEARELGLGDAGGGDEFERQRVIDFCTRRQAVPPVGADLNLEGMAKRVCCRYWWRRAIRKIVAKKSEKGAMVLGLVSAPNRQPYASNKAVFRRLDQNARNREAMEKTVLENEDGQRATLAELAAKSTGNKAIRRGELMTRIRGCEVIADAQKMPGVFLTLTCPSRFHCTRRNGKRNKKHDGSTPREAQLWLRTMWARARAEMAREGVSTFGMRVAEPHHDGCPHWHALLWFGSDLQMHQALSIIGQRWLSESKNEDGAKDYRVNAKRMESGAAAGYIAKYISKNIDDVGIGDSGHIDDYAEKTINTDFFGNVEVLPSMRVEAWASTWGIRQFQPIGQPPVTVWRELRRITQDNAKEAGQGSAIYKAWIAAQGENGVKGSLGQAGRAQRVEAECRASWSDYCMAQGGVMLGRKHKITMAVEVKEVDGKYGMCVRKMPLGVRLNWAGTACVWSERRAWRVIDTGSPVCVPVSVSSGANASPRTRVNNCTRRDANKHNRVRTLHRVVTETDIYGEDRAQIQMMDRFVRAMRDKKTRETIEKTY